MRVILEASGLLGNYQTGIARYIKNLVTELSNINKTDDFRLLYKASKVKDPSSLWAPPSMSASMHRKIYLRKTDIAHGLDYRLPIWVNAKKIITIHDLAPFKINQDFIAKLKSRKRGFKRLYKQVQKVDKIIAVSQATKNDIIELFNVPEEKVHVIHLGVEKKYFPQKTTHVSIIRNKYKLHRDYIVFVGSISGRKNTKRLVKAYSLSSAKKDFDLVLIGNIAYLGEQTINEITHLKMGEKIKLLNYVSDDDLPALYSGARGLAFPTYYEGFGLPVLESMACGTPVLSGNKGASPEICGHLSIKVDPYDVDEISNGLDKLVYEYNYDPNELYRYAQNFTWEKTASKTLQLYNELST